MARSTRPQQFVLLSNAGLIADATIEATSATFLRSVSAATATKPFTTRGAPKLKMKVLDQIAETGAKLVELDDPGAQMQLRALQPSVRLVPVRYYRTCRYRPRLAPKLSSAAATPLASQQVKIKVVSKADGSPIKNAFVVAFTNFAARQGASGTTNTSGVAKLTLSGNSIQRLFVYPELGFWSILKKNVSLAPTVEVKAAPINLAFKDCVRHFYGTPNLNAGSGVTVGIIDTGVGPHADLNVNGGACTIIGENPADFGDNGDMHGTHVGGIVASRGTPPTGIRGVAPGVRLRSYRVFPKAGHDDPSPSFAIAKAIQLAVQDGCQLINMSLKLDDGSGTPDPTVHQAIVFAQNRGSVVLVAAGNDDRSPVAFPANDALSLAVSAMGRTGTFPTGTTESADIAAPKGTDSKNFLAAFSNIGPEMDMTGLGVGVISTVLGGHGVMSGTSMACPATTGRAAALLSQNAPILGMPGNSARADAIKQLILQAARPIGFGQPLFEGLGLLP